MSGPVDPVALLTALIRAESVTPAGPAVFDIAEAALSGAGFSVERLTFAEEGADPVENLFATKGDGRHLAFAGHLDVVPPGPREAWSHDPFAAVVAGDTIYGRGAQDMKGGVAAMIAAGAAWSQKGGHGRLSFLITGDEEGVAINGTRPLVAWAAGRYPIDAAIVGEPTSRTKLGDTIKVGRRGSVSGEVRVKGVQGHVAYPEKADNPIPALFAIGETLLAPLDTGNAHFAPSNLELVSVDVGNTAFNVIPGAATLRFNVRVNDEWTVESLQAHLTSRVHAVAADAEIHWMRGASGAFRIADTALLERIAEAVEAVTGVAPEATTGGGTSDARFIKDHCPVVEFGAVGAAMHQADEHTSLAELRLLTEAYGAIIEKVLVA